MNIIDSRGRNVELELLSADLQPERALALAVRPQRSLSRTSVRGRARVRLAPRAAEPLTEASPILRACRAFFDLGHDDEPRGQASAKKGPPPASFREQKSGVVRTVYREIVVRFRPDTPERLRRSLLRKHGFTTKRQNPYVPDQVVISDPARRKAGVDLLEIANGMAAEDEVTFATPNFVSEYRRDAVASIPAAQWHLYNRAKEAGQIRGEDVDARQAWRKTKGKRAVIIAILDDGVDVDHPNLRSRIWRNSKTTQPDQCGRDFFLPDDHPDHYNPRPKKFRYPYHLLSGNDIHGTACAGVAAAAGRTVYGVAPGCRILAVKIFHADELAPDERVADAIRYAASRADVLSCSWSGGTSPDVALALADAARIGRTGLGSPIFCAAGNEEHSPVGFPASDSGAIAVGASTDQAELAWYSNVGPQLDVVAPSNGGIQDVYTTDVSYSGRGFNVGAVDAGGKDGLRTNSFGGTSSATPLAAGIGALLISANAGLTSEQVRAIMRETADKIGTGYDRRGRSRDFGYGRVNAGRAVTEAISLRS